MVSRCPDLLVDIPEGDGQAGTTFCAPYGNPCKRKETKSGLQKAPAKPKKRPSGKISSEQYWYVLFFRSFAPSTGSASCVLIIANAERVSMQGSSHALFKTQIKMMLDREN
jgi:hypothetical protein